MRRVAMVTGASGAIGLGIARGIARLPEFEVVLLCRSETKARASVERIAKETSSQALRYEIVDVSRLENIRALGKRFEGPLHVLVNNAAITPRRRTETADGIELQLATNVLAYVWLTEALLPAFERAGSARIVNVASYWAGDLDIDDLEFRRRRYDNDAAYRQSKQANRMLTRAWAERLSVRNVSVNACHPGDVRSALSESLGFGGHESPDAGARTPVWLATSDEVAGDSGAYFEHCAKRECRFAADRDAVSALDRACNAYGSASAHSAA